MSVEHNKLTRRMRNVAKEAWHFYLRRAILTSIIGEFRTQVCITDTHGKYIVVTHHSTGATQRFEVKASWQ